jgi:hypothetical protein
MERMVTIGLGNRVWSMGYDNSKLYVEEEESEPWGKHRGMMER